MNRINRRAYILVTTGLLAAVIAAVVVYYLLSSVQSQRVQQPTVIVEGPTPAPTRIVIVAATDIIANSVITTSEIVTGSYPADLVPADAVTSLSQVVGTTTKVPVFSGQIVLQRQFIAAGGSTGASVDIPPGKVLVAFPSTDMLNATGAVAPGDHVDIMVSLPISGTGRVDAQSGSPVGSQFDAAAKPLVSQMTLQNIEVYTVGEWSPPGQASNSQAGTSGGAGTASAGANLKIITFIVDHQEALILKYIKDSDGIIDLAVRSAADNKTVSTDAVSLDYLVDLYGYLGLARPAGSNP